MVAHTIADALGGVLPPDRYRVSQDPDGRVSLDVVPGERAEPAADALRALIGERPISATDTLPAPHESVEKTHPVRSSAPLRLP